MSLVANPINFASISVSGRDNTRNEGLERERDEYDVTTRDSIPLSVYMQGGRE